MSKIPANVQESRTIAYRMEPTQPNHPSPHTNPYRFCINFKCLFAGVSFLSESLSCYSHQEKKKKQTKNYLRKNCDP